MLWDLNKVRLFPILGQESRNNNVGDITRRPQCFRQKCGKSTGRLFNDLKHSSLLLITWKSLSQIFLSHLETIVRNRHVSLAWWCSSISNARHIWLRVRISREWHDTAQTLYSPKQELKMSICSWRCILRYHVAGKIDGDPRQTTLGVGCAEDAGTCEGGKRLLVVVYQC